MVGKSVIPERSHYRVRISIDSDESPVPSQIRGTVVIAAEPESFFGRFWRFVLAVLIRESGF